MRSIEGKRGEPRPRPPFPAVRGSLGEADGPQQRRDPCQRASHHRQRLGLVPIRGNRRRARGTKIFALTGKVNNVGLVEVNMGIPLGRDHLRHRRRHPQREEVQGRPDRRTVGRVHPEGAPERARGLRVHHRAGLYPGSPRRKRWMLAVGGFTRQWRS